jgi:predicted acetyltransferase
VVLDVRDPGLPANNGRWRLTAAAFDQPTATRTDAPADLAMDVRDLAAVYLGGVTVMELAAAGRIEELAPGAAPRASVAFTWPVAPACSYFF